MDDVYKSEEGTANEIALRRLAGADAAALGKRRLGFCVVLRPSNSHLPDHRPKRFSPPRNFPEQNQVKALSRLDPNVSECVTSGEWRCQKTLVSV